MSGYDPRFGIFSGPAVDLGTEQELIKPFSPISQLKNNQSIEFSIGASSQSYIDLSRTKLCLSLRILGEDGNPIPNGEKVSTVNLALHSLFRQVDFIIQDQNISPDTGVCYPYKAMLDTLLENDTEYLQSSGMTEFFYKDTAGEMDSTEPTKNGLNVGLGERGMRTNGGKVVQLCGVLHTDLMSINSYLPTGIGIKVKLYPITNHFVLMAENVDKRYSVEITECAMHVQYIEPTKQLLLAHNELLSKGPALFSFWRTNFRTSSIPANMTTWGVDGIFSDKIVALVSASAFTGAYNKNPFNFKNYKLSYLSFNVEGTPVNGNEFHPDFENELYVNEYLSIFNEKGRPGKGSIINWGDYPKGYTIYKFNVREAAHAARNERIRCGRAGQSTLKFRFEAPLPEPVMLICYARFRSVLKINQDRKVYL